MENNKSRILGFIIVAVIVFVFLSTVWLMEETDNNILTNSQGKDKTPEILVFEETQFELLYEINQRFPDYKVQKIKKRNLARFLESRDMIMAYDVQALPLVDEQKGPYFYPLYEDAVVIMSNMTDGEVPNSWEKVLQSGLGVSIQATEAGQRFIWQTVSYGLSGQINKEVPADYFAALYERGLLEWGNFIAPIQIGMHSTYMFSRWHRDALQATLPQEGSVLYQVGLLSRHRIEQPVIDELRQVFKEYGYLPVDVRQSHPLLQGHHIIAAKGSLTKFVNYGEINNWISRRIKKTMRYAPDRDKEHHIVAIVLIVLIVFGINRVNQTVIHLGVRRGIIYTGFLLIGWIIVAIFKYSFYGEVVYIRALWYSYYFFILMLSPMGLYVTASINRYDKNVYPKWTILSWILSLAIFLMVITNDYHQLVFRFLVSDSNLWHLYYKRNIGYYLVAFWMAFSQIGTWIYLLHKSWDSPKRKAAFLPAMAIAAGILYSVLYNLNVPLFREIPLALGMSFLVMLFWAAILMSGLIPSNYGYHELFENSQLYMKILDNNNHIRFQSAAAAGFVNGKKTGKKKKHKNRQQLKEAEKEEESIIWSTQISGGTLVTKENIQELIKLKKNLEMMTGKLAQENHILSKREQVKSELIFVREQNDLTEEVTYVVEDKIRRMKDILTEIQVKPELRKKGLIQLQRMAIYCKRRCELLIRAKQHEYIEAKDFNRLIDEVNLVSSVEYIFFNELDRDMPFSLAVEAYEGYHLFCEVALEKDVTSMTARLLMENNEIYLYFLAEQNGEKIYQQFQKRWQSKDTVGYKNLGDAFSMVICLKEGRE